MENQYTFTCTLHWSGNVADYDTFSRRHDIQFPGGKELPSSTFLQGAGTDATNPEELLAAAQSSCMMLTFLAVCSKSKVNILRYDDKAEALLERVDGKFRVTKITLRPQVVVAGAVEREKLNLLFEKAHANCYIGNSIRADVLIDPTYLNE